MSNHNPQRQTDEASSSEQTVTTLLLTMADTTWRMITPTALLAVLALMADLHWHTKPWLTLASVPAGLAISVLLIKRQLRAVAS